MGLGRIPARWRQSIKSKPRRVPNRKHMQATQCASHLRGGNWENAPHRTGLSGAAPGLEVPSAVRKVEWASKQQFSVASASAPTSVPVPVCALTALSDVYGSVREMNPFLSGLLSGKGSVSRIHVVNEKSEETYLKRHYSHIRYTDVRWVCEHQ